MKSAKRFPLHRVDFSPKVNYRRFCGVGYPDTSLNQEIERLRDLWQKVQASRHRPAIYEYLKAAYELVLCWQVECQEIQRTRRALKINGLAPPKNPEPFAAVIAASVSPSKLDRRQVSKYSRALQYAASRDCHPDDLKRLIQGRHGGLNACAAKYSLRLRRQ